MVLGTLLTRAALCALRQGAVRAAQQGRPRGGGGPGREPGRRERAAEARGGLRAGPDAGPRRHQGPGVSSLLLKHMPS